MKIKDIQDPQQFFNKVRNCRGIVELVTSEGDRLNLKSTLCQYLALTQMLSDDGIDTVELLVSEPDDLKLLAPHIVRD